MDCALWDPSDYQVARESSYHIGHGWQSDFCFGRGLDVIEENALNEKACIQVLRILITKADTEIIELEEDLVILQSQLAWADKEWSALCSATLRERIDCLDSSIQSLKNKNVDDEHDLGVCLTSHKEPAERMHEIVKALLRNYFQPKDEQSAESIIKASSSDSMGHATNLLVEKKRLSKSSSNTIRKEKVKELAITPGEKHTILKSSLKPPRKKTNNPVTIKSPSAVVQNSSSSVEKHEISQPQERKLSNSDSKTSGEEVMEKTSTPSAPISNFSLKPEGKRTDLEEKNKPEDSNIQDSSLDSSRHATSYSSEKKDLNKLDLGINGKLGVRTHKSIHNNNCKIPNSSLKKAGKEMNLLKTIKPANAMVKDSRLHASRHAAVSNGRRKLSKIDSEGTSKEEVKEYSSIDGSKTLESSSELGGDGIYIVETVKPADTIPDSRSGALQQVTEESNAKSKLSKQSAATPDKIDISNLYLKKEQNTIETPQRLKDQEASLTVTEHTAMDSLLELPNHRRENTTKPKPQPMKQRPQLKRFRKAELTATDGESNSNMPQKPQRQKRKRKCLSDPQSVQEPCLSVEIGLKSASVAKFKRGQNSGIVDRDASFNQSPNKIRKKETPSDLRSAEEPGVAPEVSINSGPQSRKKRESSSNFPSLKETKGLIGVQICLANATGSMTEEDLWIAKSFSEDSDIETVKSQPCPMLRYQTLSISNMECLTLDDLKAIAKQQRLKGYYRLRKAELAAELGLMLQVRGKKNEKSKGPSTATDQKR